ncbi:MAG: hypothetical protein VXW27_10190, partial [Pseudomonadota bacterium]|nr:hypothetical protein [Pseudomonadota bacterium]
PANGYVHGNEIKCALGFALQRDGTCGRVIVPANAILVENGWRCRAGFEQDGKSCVALVVPANAYVRGNNWFCRIGWHRVRDDCLRTVVPANATLRGDN